MTNFILLSYENWLKAILLEVIVRKYICVHTLTQTNLTKTNTYTKSTRSRKNPSGQFIGTFQLGKL